MVPYGGAGAIRQSAIALRGSAPAARLSCRRRNHWHFLPPPRFILQEDAMPERIVAVGLLTERDLEILGEGFRRHFPIPQDDLFDELIEKLNKLPLDDPQAGTSDE
jgi:hypothetical protein